MGEYGTESINVLVSVDWALIFGFIFSNLKLHVVELSVQNGVVHCIMQMMAPLYHLQFTDSQGASTSVLCEIM